jgi:archaeal flagellar protein FlaJ
MNTPANKYAGIKTLSYKIFGKLSSRFMLLKPIYEKSGLSIWYESYIALMIFSSIITFIAVLGVGLPLHYILFGLAVTHLVPVVLMLAVVAAILVVVIFVVYPINRVNQRKTEIESSLIYTTGYMGVLAAGGISIEQIFDRVNQVERHIAIKELAKRLTTDVNVFGLDIIAALNDVIKRSPSVVFSKLLDGITNTLKTSGDLKGLLTFETERLLSKKREDMKKTLNTLLGLGEVYIAGVVMGPVTFIIMITILSVMGNVAFGMSPILQLNLLVFLGIPAICMIFIIILNSVLPEEE